MILHAFNFAQPWWLCGLLLVPAGWLWYRNGSRFTSKNLGSLEKFADQQLLPHLLISTAQAKKKSSTQGWLYAALISCLVIALANPRWDFKEIDAYAPTASMVIIFDLGDSMSVDDVAPSRIILARQNIEDLINMSRGLKIGVLGFAAIPHLISPITDDIQTIKGFLPAIDTNLITKQGDSLKLALDAAADLLDREPGDKKSILLVSDGNFADIDYAQQLKNLTAKNISVNVMAVGTVAGTAYRDQKHRIVMSKLDQEKLQIIAQQGNGVYVDAKRSEAGIEKILDKVQQQDSSKHIISGKIKQWEDRYYLLLIPAMLIFLALMAQRAFYTVLILVVSFGLLGSNKVHALELQNIFKNSAQQGLQEFVSGNFAHAAQLFSDPYHKGVALYRAGDFAAAEQAFNASRRDSIKTTAIYNAGNAQMQQQKWRSAINSYEQVLKIEPDNLDAQFNLALARKMLAENGDKPEDKQDNKQDKPDDKNKEQDPKKDEKQDNKQDKPDDKSKEHDPKKDDKPESKPASKPAPTQAPQNSPLLEDIDAPIQQSTAENAEQEARAQQWLNRIDSDIKVFLKNKFYVEDMLSAK